MNNPCFALKKEEGNVMGKLSISNISAQSQKTGASTSNEKEFWQYLIGHDSPEFDWSTGRHPIRSDPDE